MEKVPAEVPPGRCAKEFRIRCGQPVIRPGAASLPRPLWGPAMANPGTSFPQGAAVVPHGRRAEIEHVRRVGQVCIVRQPGGGDIAQVHERDALE